jgi:hypothetical protein
MSIDFEVELVWTSQPAVGNSRSSTTRLCFCLSLNPVDGEDGGILTTIDDMANPQARDTGLQEFSEGVALLLKHDWESGSTYGAFIVATFLPSRVRREPLPN